MAVAFMAALEDTPETYEEAFDQVLEGRGSRIRERILGFVKPGMRVLDLGCGPGLFAMEAARKGAEVIGIDSNENMIALAKMRAASLDSAPVFMHANVLALGEDTDSRTSSEENHGSKFDLVVSTFLLSELKPTQRDLFFQIVKELLSNDGVLAVAAESLPESSSDRRSFWKNRARVEKSAQVRLPPPIDSLEELVQNAGLSIEESGRYGPEITLLVARRAESIPSNEYQNMSKPFHGAKARVRIWYNHLSGGWRGIPIKPGLYRAGEPSPESPVIVTANYELTYYTVMRALAKDGIDAWVLVCDTNGINVWCAARGTHFDSDDIVQMIQLTRLAEFVNHKELTMPQLSAAGMDPQSIRRRTGFRVRYGPVRIQDLAQWLELGKPRPKPREMATVTFNLRERMEQTVAHIPFLFAALLAKPVFGLLGLLALVNVPLALVIPEVFLALFPFSLGTLILVAEFILALAGNAFILGLLFPILPSKGNSFWRRGLGLAGITLPLAALIMLALGVHWTEFVGWMVVQFILATSLTMDWSGMTSVSDPKVIRREYPYMIQTLKIGTAFIVIFAIVVVIMGW
ncbi:MAG: methyltransferase domain-containing protein [Candidatus Sifarchaeia archaeon]